jgi:hypothetical protein
VDVAGEGPRVTVRDPQGQVYRIEARFLLDASGFGRVWYAGGFQKIIFFDRRMIAAILAGYTWDQSNPYVREPKRRFATLEELCGASI